VAGGSTNGSSRLGRLHLLPRWSQLNALGESRILRSSYLWLVLVPVAAKFIDVLPKEFEAFSTSIRMDFELPFSWTLFYFSSVAFAAASLLYATRCPSVVKFHRHAADFAAKGKSFDHLIAFASELGEPLRGKLIKKIEYDRAHLRPEALTEVIYKLFWNVYAKADSRRRQSRALCGVLYVVGFVLIGIVMAQNFLYVIEAV